VIVINDQEAVARKLSLVLIADGAASALLNEHSAVFLK
jgi:hypothetical protein